MNNEGSLKSQVLNKNTEISWQAQEYVQRSKNAGWYFGLILVGAVLIGLAFWLGGWKWWSFMVLVAVSVLALIVYSVRPPRVLTYKLNNEGLAEGQKLYQFKEYKSFGLLRDGEHYAIVLTPRKRFSGRLTVFFPEGQGEQIVDAFGARLPMEEVKLDVIDKIVKILRI